jgi:hypothetical protein
MGWMAQFELQQGQDFFLLHSIKISSETHITFCPMGTKGSFPSVKAAEA